MLTLIQANLLSFSLGPSFAGIGQIRSPGEPQSKISAPQLSLRYQDLKSEPTTFDLLSWHTRVADFVGREKEIEDLAAWAYSSPAVLAQFVISEGGIRKSRLAAFFGELLKKDGWSAGFIDLREPRSFPMKKKGTLLVVDYPEENESGVKELLNDLAIVGNEVRLRVLFLTRQEMTAWDEIIMASNSRTIVETRPLALSPLSGTVPHDLYKSALKKTASLIKTSPPPLPDDAFTEWLKQDIYHHSRALFIMALAVYSAMNPDETAVKYSGREVIEALAQREIKRIYRIADRRQYQDPLALARLLAVATIADELSLEQIASLAQNAELELGLPEGANLRRELKTTGILTEDAVNAPKPDIVAAAFLIKVLKENQETAPELIWAALKNDIEGGLKRISRLSYDAEVVLNILNPRLSKWLAEAANGHRKRSAMLEGFFTLSPPPLAWVEAAIASRETLLKEVEDNEKRAWLLNNLSNDLYFAGDSEGALRAIQEAVEIRRRLAATNPARFESYLATSLNNMSSCLSATGDTPGALNAIQEAVEIYRRLATANPARFDPDLAMSLNNLSNCLSATGDTPGALKAIQEAVEIYRRLATANPARFDPDLATSLGALGTVLRITGEFERAAESFTEGIELVRPYAEQWPESPAAKLLAHLESDLEESQKLMKEQ